MTTDSHNGTSTKSCFSGILRRILCTGSLPTHPSNSDIVPESDHVYVDKKNVQVKGQGTPGVVARLMGLESLPDIKWIPKDSINFRSKSIRSADYFPQFDHLSQDHSQHRRVKTSVSFREIPTFLHQQNEDLFVVCFDRGDDNNAMGLKMMTNPDKEVKNVKRSSRSASGKTKETVVMKKKEKQDNRKRNVEPKRSSLKTNYNVLPYYNKSNEVYIRSSPRLKKKRPTRPRNSFCEEVSSGMKHARMSENRTATKARTKSSSNTGSSSDSLTTTSENSRKKGLNNIPNPKKHSIPKLEKVEYPCRSNSFGRLNVDDDQEVTSQITKSDSSMKCKEVEFYVKNFVEVCRLNEEDTQSSNNWPWIKSKVIEIDDCEDICLDTEQHVLDMLLQQLVDELC